jgi:hypothetical protein
MNNKINNLSRKIARFSYLLGIASMLVAMVLSIVHQPAKADDYSPCGVGFEVKLTGSGPFTYTTNPGYVISQVGIKSGASCFYFTANGSDGCYQVSGIGTPTVYIGGGGTGSDCQAISHVIIFTAQKITPTEPPPTEPPPTEPPPTEPPPTEPPPTEPPPTEPPPTEPPPTEPPPTEPPPTEPPPTEPPPTEPPPTEPPPTEPPPTEPPSTEPPPTETPVVTETPPVTTETPVVTETPETPVVTETPDPETPEPTLPPPPQIVQNDQPALLIPVTGADLSLGAASADQLQSLFGSLGLAFFGLGLVFTGIAKRKDR